MILYFDGNPWDGMGWDRHELLWDGMGRERKKCPMDKPANMNRNVRWTAFNNYCNWKRIRVDTNHFWNVNF